MEMNDLVQAFGNGFFPCVMCGALFWYMMKQNEMHQTESKEMKEAITKLEEAILKLTERLTGGSNEI